MHKLYCRFIYVRDVTRFGIRDGSGNQRYRFWFDGCLYISPYILLEFELTRETYPGDTMKLLSDSFKPCWDPLI